MRISTFKGDAGYRPDIHRFTVTLDGKPIRSHVLLLADTESGIVVTNKCDHRGEIFVQDCDTVTVIQSGKVTITEREDVVVKAPAEVPFG